MNKKLSPNHLLNSLYFPIDMAYQFVIYRVSILDLFMVSFFCFISYFSISVSITYFKKLLYLARPTPQLNFSLIVSWLFLPFCCKDYFMFIYPLWGSEGLSILGECFSWILENFLPLFLWIFPFTIFLTFLPVLLIGLLFLRCHSC